MSLVIELAFILINFDARDTSRRLINFQTQLYSISYGKSFLFFKTLIEQQTFVASCAHVSNLVCAFRPLHMYSHGG